MTIADFDPIVQAITGAFCFFGFVLGAVSLIAR